MNAKRVSIVVTHGNNDLYVPVIDAETIARKLSAELIWIPNGKHLNGSAGFSTLPECLSALQNMMK